MIRELKYRRNILKTPDGSRVMDLMLLMFQPLRKYAIFSRRAGREEFWSWLLLLIIIYFVLVFIESALGLFPQADINVLASIFPIALIIPSIALYVRRLHDLERSGWGLYCILSPLLTLFYLFTLVSSKEPRVKIALAKILCHPDCRRHRSAVSA